MKTFRKGGVHPNPNKLSASAPIVTLDLPRRVSLLLGQSIGAPAEPVVAKGDHVERGQLVAKAVGFVSANLHTPISGTVARIEPIRSAVGLMAPAIVITANEADHQADLDADKYSQPAEPRSLEALSPAEIVEAVKAAGLVGLGGATFPTAVKLTPPPGCTVDSLLVNGSECEPYLTCDDALMRSQAPEIVLGARLLAKAVGANRVIVGIEANKPEAIEAMKSATANEPSVTVVPLKTKYPQGGEKQLVDALTGRTVPEGGLPANAGCVVQNVATCFAAYEAVMLGKPLIERVLTVTGLSVEHPTNLRVALGTELQDVVAQAGGVPADTGKTIVGGPMMGKSVAAVEGPTVKGLSGLVFMPERLSQRPAVNPCVRCAVCVGACPMGLEPYLLAKFGEAQRTDEAEAHGVMSCVECGCCSYSCPSRRPLLDYIRVAKTKVGAAIRARKQQNK